MPEKTYPIAVLIRNHVFTTATPGDPKRITGTHKLGEHLQGRLSAESARRVAGNDFRPALGTVLQTPEGPELYRIHDAVRDLENILQANGLREVKMPDVDAMTVDQQATVLDLALDCLDDKCASEPAFLTEALANADPELLGQILPGLTTATKTL